MKTKRLCNPPLMTSVTRPVPRKWTTGTTTSREYTVSENSAITTSATSLLQPWKFAKIPTTAAFPVMASAPNGQPSATEHSNHGDRTDVTSYSSELD